MPTTDPHGALTLEAARERVIAQSFPRDREASARECVGLEPEYFAVETDESGVPRSRLRLDGEEGVLALFDALEERGAFRSPRDRTKGLAPAYELKNGGRLTFEPGAQIEHSTATHPSCAAAMADIDQTAALLAQAVAVRGARMAALGLDLWFDGETVEQQLRAPRYPAMASYLAQRGPGGRTMMRYTASLQINLDLGPESVTRERWWLSNLISPLMTASFAASPQLGAGPDAVCARALAWQELDSTRTGFPAGLLRRTGSDPAEDWAEAALTADVMMFRDNEGGIRAGRQDFSFLDWIREGAPELGWPTVDDLDYHLTTLFFEVRPRGFIELRAADALPPRWRAAPVVLVTGLMYDATARSAALALLEPGRPELPELWKRAATVGLADPELAAAARSTWTLALEGAERMTSGYFRSQDMDRTREFLERFTFRGRAPSDELREAHAKGPEHALEWASLELASETEGIAGKGSA